MRFARLIPISLALLIAACASLPPPRATTPVAEAEAREPVTILVSIDGFRPDYLHRGDTPRLDALAADGVLANMKPAFPTLTFPNHYAMVTGLSPDHNGITDNTMEDPRRPGMVFKNSDPKQTRDGFWWDEAEPIWVSAERTGIRTGTMFWPGVEAEIRGLRPSNWFAYAAEQNGDQRVDAVIDWLRRPADTRPKFLTLYFDTVDKRSHDAGYYSAEKMAAIRDSDRWVARLVDGLAALGQPANLVIVSDHGMAPVPPEHQMPTAPFFDPAVSRSINSGPLLFVYPLAGQEAATAARILAPHPHAQCWRREAMPARFHYGHNPRIAPFVCLSEIGWRFAQSEVPKFIKGDHGWDNADPSMRALFIANGPGFARGQTLPIFDNVDVYPLLRDLIGLPPVGDIDGTDAPFRGVRAR